MAATTHSSMYHTMYLDERVSLSPSDINTASEVPDGSAEDGGFKQMLETRLKEKYEGRCNVNGYVRTGSVELLQRSVATGEHGRFTGNIVYDCKFKCTVLHPTAGIRVDAIALKVNKMGVYAVFEDAAARDETMIRILLPRDIHLGNEEFDSIQESDKLQVSLERSKFQTNDPFIVSVGRLVSKRVIE
jgi:hypothetical protein